MNKQEYLQQLSHALSFLEEEAKNAVLSFYTEMLEDRIESGMTEEAAVAALEDAQIIAGRLKSEMPGKDRHLTGKELGETVRISCAASELRGILLRGKNIAIRVLPGEGSSVTLLYPAAGETGMNAGMKNGVFTFLRTDSVIYHAENRSGILVLDYEECKPALFTFSRSHPPITLYLPKDACLPLEMETSNGKISLEGPLSLTLLKGKTTNGGVSAEKLLCREMTLTTTNGSFSLTRVEAEADIRCTTTNASFTVREVSAGGKISLSTRNGSLNLRDVSAGNTLDADTSNASIQFSGLTARALNLQTSNGNIKGTLPGCCGDYAIQSGTSNGRNSLPASQPGDIPLSVHTSNASIQVEFENK